jgi:para-nitrobenzyl esterase
VSASSPAFHVYSRERARNWAADYLKVLGIEGRDGLSEIERLPARTLIMAALAFDRQTQREAPGSISVSYVVDDDLLPEAPIAAIRGGRAHRVPLLIGTCRNEHALFAKVMKDELAFTPAEIETLFAASGAGVLDSVLEAYTVNGRTDHARIGGDAAFWYPSVAIAEAHSHHAPTRMFRVDHGPRIFKLLGFGASHGSDVALLFGDVDRVERFLGGARANDAFTRNLRADLTTFAQGGEPVGVWPLYDSVDRQTRLYAKGTPIVSDPEGDRRAAWQGYVGYP